MLASLQELLEVEIPPHAKRKFFCLYWLRLRCAFVGLLYLYWN